VDKLGHWQAEQLVFVDESGVNPKTGERVYGYSKKGTVARQQVLGPKMENYSLLPALSLHGYIACNVYVGAVDGETFLDFIEQDVLPHCTKFPGPRSIIIMDNAAIHNVHAP
jgi:DDE superfamily endonuclease